MLISYTLSKSGISAVHRSAASVASHLKEEVELPFMPIDAIRTDLILL